MKYKNHGNIISTDSLDVLKHSLKKLEKQLESIPFELWPEKPQNGGWSTAEIIHHLILMEVQGLQELKDILEGRKESLRMASTEQIDLTQLRNHKLKLKAVASYEPTAGIPAKYLLEALRRARKETIMYAQKVGSKRLRKIGISTPWFGAVNGREFLICLAYHMDRHTTQISENINKK